MKNKRRKKSPLPKEDHDRLMKMKETLLNIKKMLNEAKEEAEALDEEKIIALLKDIDQLL